MYTVENLENTEKLKGGGKLYTISTPPPAPAAPILQTMSQNEKDILHYSQSHLAWTIARQLWLYFWVQK